jgi:hypothetical protein
VQVTRRLRGESGHYLTFLSALKHVAVLFVGGIVVIGLNHLLCFVSKDCKENVLYGII